LFRIALLANLKSHGLHDVFHASLLRIHAPNDDRLFPGRLDSQVEHMGGMEGEWMIERVRTHAGKALAPCLKSCGNQATLPGSRMSRSPSRRRWRITWSRKGLKVSGVSNGA
jgi:hypothetical protein